MQSAISASADASSEFLDGVDVEARAYQQRIISKAISMFAGRWSPPAVSGDDADAPFEREAHSVLVESPTGSGKTIMALAIARCMQREFGDSIGWVAMRRNLLTQADRENRARGFRVEMELISMFDKHPPKVDMLIVDEAQHDAAMSMANLHCSIRPRKILGLTATPFRADRIKLCFDRVIKDAGIHHLIQDGYLSRYHHYTVPEYTPRSVADMLIREPERWGKSLVFFHRQHQCEECRAALAMQGIRAEVVTTRTDRERQIAEFAAGRFNVLINMAILSEGFDCPSLKTVFCRPSGKAFTIQMGGRVFRRHPDHPFKQIVQCRHTRHPFIRTAMADEQYVWSEGQWQALKLNRRIEAVTTQVRNALAKTRVELPDLVAAHRSHVLPWRRDS